MKKLKILITFVFAAILFGCAGDDGDSLDDLANAPAPSNISALFTITQDNSGLVTIAPRGEGATKFDIYYGDGTEESAEVPVGNTISHVYAEGNYSVKVVGVGLNGKTSEYVHDLTVSFVAPENLAVTIAPVTGDSFSVNVSATADLEAFFEVWFGESETEEPVQFNEGETIMHTYAAIGTYTVTVVAYSGGAATAEYTQEVTITNPLLLPLDFESATLNYAFTDFGNATTTVIDNPQSGGINTSSKVGRFVKNGGAETWAGTFIVTDQPVDFSTFTNFKMKVWSPLAGSTVVLKLENAADANIFHEVQVQTSVTNEWEDLSLDFSGADMNAEYSKIVLFFHFGVAGNGETFYFDDIRLSADDQSQILPLNFEYSIDYIINGFGGANGSKVANPQSGGINTSNNVGQLIKNAGSETWAGIAIPLVEAVDFSSMQKVKMKVWSPAAGTPVLLKFEKEGDNTVFVEATQTTTVAGGWEELTYDYTGTIDNTVNYKMAVIFFDFGNAGTGATYYFDDIQLTN